MQRHATLPDAVLGKVEIPQRLAPGDTKLGVDHVHICRFLGDGMLHLDARVHLDEYVTPVLAHEEFHRAGAQVVYGAPEADGSLTQSLAQPPLEVRRRRYLQHLLVAALHRAVPLEEVDDLARRVGQHLDLDVPWPYEGLLQEDRGVAKRGLCLPRRGLDRLLQIHGPLDQPQSSPPTAAGRLHEHRVAYPLGGVRSLLWTCQRSGGSQYGDACLLGDQAGA